jgi:DNA invertase Pin-like site-specific DNA recombinase
VKNNKVTEDQLLEIRDRVAKGESVADLAKEFGTSGRVIYYHIGKSGSKKTNALAQARLERENQALKIILAETMVELDKEKKLKLQNALKNI